MYTYFSSRRVLSIRCVIIDEIFFYSTRFWILFIKMLQERHNTPKQKYSCESRRDWKTMAVGLCRYYLVKCWPSSLTHITSIAFESRIELVYFGRIRLEVLHPLGLPEFQLQLANSFSWSDYHKGIYVSGSFPSILIDLIIRLHQIISSADSSTKPRILLVNVRPWLEKCDWDIRCGLVSAHQRDRKT